MTRKKKNILFVHSQGNIIGVINNSDLMKRVIAPNLGTEKQVMEIMSAPVVSIPESALLYEAVLLLRSKNISHLAVKNEKEEILGVISYEDIVGTHQNSVSFLITVRF